MKKKFQKMIKKSIILLILLIVIYLVYTYVGERVLVSGVSMEPTLQDGDQIMLNKITYQFEKPQRYDIIVIENAYRVDSNYIKRIIGLPGEEIFYDEDGHVTINGQVLSGELRFEESDLSTWEMITQSIVLGANEYFVLGDNRNNSVDSRSSVMGVISIEDIIGKAEIRIYPFQNIKRLN